MAKLVYDETGRLLFTKEMKEEYTILMPQMLPVHFGMFQRLLELEGYKVDMLTSNHRGIIDEGLKYVHNDTCYPALLVIGQLMDAIESGKYDIHKIALILPQTAAAAVPPTISTCSARHWKERLRLYSGHFAELFRSGEQPRLQADQDHGHADRLRAADRRPDYDGRQPVPSLRGRARLDRQGD